MLLSGSIERVMVWNGVEWSGFGGAVADQSPFDRPRTPCSHVYSLVATSRDGMSYYLPALLWLIRNVSLLLPSSVGRVARVHSLGPNCAHKFGRRQGEYQHTVKNIIPQPKPNGSIMARTASCSHFIGR